MAFKTYPHKHFFSPSSHDYFPYYSDSYAIDPVSCLPLTPFPFTNPPASPSEAFSSCLPNRRSNSLSTLITDAASISKAVRSGAEDGLAIGVSWGTQVFNSFVAVAKAGCRDKVVKASAQVRVGHARCGCGDADAGIDVAGVGFLVVEGRFAATVLQKRVLVGLERHCAQVPGPLIHGFDDEGVIIGGALEDWWCDLSFAISAQMHGVSSEQKPHGSGGAMAAIDDEEEDVVGRLGGRRALYCDVKSISTPSSI